MRGPHHLNVSLCSELVRRRTRTRVCALSDASDLHWAAVTQCPHLELSKSVTDQVHEPLAFLRGSFTDTQEHWSTYEKEAYAVVQTFRKLNYLLACERSVNIFTDHRNLLFAFHPSALEPSLGRHKMLKVIRWALFLSTFSYRIEHVPGDQNTLADILTRWMRGYRGRVSYVKRVAAILPFTGVPRAPMADDDDWPTRSAILDAQRSASEPLPQAATRDDDGPVRCDGAAWVPSDAIDLKVRLLTIAHAGVSGHRGVDSTLAVLLEHFRWKGVRRDVRDFVAAFLLCVMSKCGTKVPRPLAATLHATKPNEVLHFDYLFLGNSNAGDMYVLTVKDDLSGYCWLCPTPNANAEHAATIVARWNRKSSSPAFWISDQGSHFVNEVLSSMATAHNIVHKPTVAYSPWSNGTAERLMRDVLAALRAVLGELKLAPHGWTAVIESIPSALNESPLTRLGRNSDGTTRTPLQVMTGIRPRRSALRILRDGQGPRMPALLDRVCAEQLMQVSALRQSLNILHKDVAERISKRQERAIRDHNRATNIEQPKFAVGDFVLVRRRTNSEHKLTFKWCGPRMISSTISPLVYLVKSLNGGREEKVHCARMMPYRNAFEGTEVPPDVLDLADRTESRYEIIDAIVDVGEASDGLFFQVRWDGLPDKRDFTRHAIRDLYEDVPQLVTEFLRTTRKRRLAAKIMQQLGISS